VPHFRDRARSLSTLARRTAGRSRGGRVLLAAVVIGLLAAPVAVGQGAASALVGGQRNPSNNASSSFTRETEIVGNVAQNQGGVAANTGGYTTRQSNKSDSGGGAIYGCRAKAGTESCVAANNLNNGDAFRFQSTPSAASVGQIRFGNNPAVPVDKPPFTTNATGLVKNLDADRVDGKSAEDFMAAGSVRFAVVAADGTIGAGSGLAANAKATVAADAGDEVVTVPFAADVTKCAATASPTAAIADPLIVGVGSNGTSITVREPNVTAAVGFNLQVTC
jgi:hypothetical protein